MGSPATPGADRLTDWDPQNWRVADDWRPVVKRFLAGEAARNLEQFVRGRLATGATIYPPQPFCALALTPLSQVKVVILGQDPYHGPGQAHGLAFSVPPGVRVPPSLRNILAEIDHDHGAGASPGSAPTRVCDGVPRDSGSLVRWAQQGVLLLNTCLTVEQGQPRSHVNQGWEALTDSVISAVSQLQSPVVLMFWGSSAQARQRLAANAPAGVPRLILTANHPSPLSARRPPKPFVGCGHFGLANAFLRQHGLEPVNWQM